MRSLGSGPRPACAEEADVAAVAELRHADRGVARVVGREVEERRDRGVGLAVVVAEEALEVPCSRDQRTTPAAPSCSENPLFAVTSTASYCDRRLRSRRRSPRSGRRESIGPGFVMGYSTLSRRPRAGGRTRQRRSCRRPRGRGEVAVDVAHADVQVARTARTRTRHELVVVGRLRRRDRSAPDAARRAGGDGVEHRPSGTPSGTGWVRAASK